MKGLLREAQLSIPNVTSDLLHWLRQARFVSEGSTSSLGGRVSGEDKAPIPKLAGDSLLDECLGVVSAACDEIQMIVSKERKRSPDGPVQFKCANPSCGKWFEPARMSQKYHDDKCRYEAKRRLRKVKGYIDEDGGLADVA